MAGQGRQAGNAGAGRATRQVAVEIAAYSTVDAVQRHGVVVERASLKPTFVDEATARRLERELGSDGRPVIRRVATPDPDPSTEAEA